MKAKEPKKKAAEVQEEKSEAKNEGYIRRLESEPVICEEKVLAPDKSPDSGIYDMELNEFMRRMTVVTFAHH